MNSHISIRARVYAAFGILIAVILVMSALTLNRLTAVERAVDEGTAALSAARHALADAQQALAQATHDAAGVVAGDAAGAAQAAQELQHVASALARYGSGPGVSRAEAAEVAVARAGVDVLTQGLPRVLASRSAGEKPAEVGAAVRSLADPLRQSLLRLQAMNEERARTAAARILDEVALARMAVLWPAAAALVLALGLAIALYRVITRPFLDAVAVTRKLAAGDLTADVPLERRSEVGQLMTELKEMTGSLSELVQQLRWGTDSMSTAAGQIESGAEDLSHGTREQAGSLDETAAAIGKLGATVKGSAASAQQANQLAQAATQMAVEGGAAAGSALANFASIRGASRKVADIARVIDALAFQTKIVALNAVVEAARVGDAGRNFVAVAEEARALARRCGEAAQQIKTVVQDSERDMEAGSQQVAHAGKTMQDVAARIRRVSELVAGIAGATLEQSREIQQVNRTVGKIDLVTQQNAQLVQEACAAARSMRDQAGALIEALGAFTVAADREALAAIERARHTSLAGTRSRPGRPGDGAAGDHA